MKSAIVVVSAILLVAALAEGASIHLREKRHHDDIDPGFSVGWRDQFRPSGIRGHGGQSSASSDAKSAAQSDGGFHGGASSSSGAGSSASGLGGLSNSKSQSQSESFAGGNGRFTSSSSSSSSSSSAGGRPLHFH